MVIPFVPRRYQQRAIERILDQPGHGLFLDCGLGKTSIILAVIAELLDGCEISSALVIAPMRVCYTTWVEEPRKWAPFAHLRVHNLHGSGSSGNRLGARSDPLLRPPPQRRRPR